MISFQDDLEKMKYCPLCQKKWVIIDFDGKEENAYFACFECEISIWIRDPMVGKWETFDKVTCPTCKNQDMRFFCRSDQGCVWFCPNCKTRIDSYDEEKHGKRDPEVKRIVMG